MRNSQMHNTEMGLYYALKAWDERYDRPCLKGIIFDFDLFGVVIRYFG